MTPLKFIRQHKNFCLALCLLSLVSSESFAAKKYYKWVDDKGVTLYSETPPRGQSAQTVTTYSSRGTPAPQTAAEKAKQKQAASKQAEAQNTQEETRERIKDPSLCRSAKENLQVITTNHRIRLRNEDGTMALLSEEDKQKQKQDALKIIADHCE